MAGTPSSWRLTHHFGCKDSDDAEAATDAVTALEFDDTGDYIAAGDRRGRVYIFERTSGSCKKQEDEAAADESSATPAKATVSVPAGPDSRGLTYGLYAEFQAQEAEFDYLRSMEIEERINDVKWMKRMSNAHMMLTTSDKTIKLWRVETKHLHQLSYPRTESNTPLRIPRMIKQEQLVSAKPRRVFTNVHSYHINSISINSDCETFVSADDLRVNLWNMNVENQSFNIVDIKPDNMEDLTEVITMATFHPIHCNIFAYSTSRGVIRLADMRRSALCNSHAQVFQEPGDSSKRTFFSEIISSISDIKFSQDGRYMLSRDYMTLRFWDIMMSSRPIKAYTINEGLRSKLCDLYENDGIFDKFRCSWSPDSRYFVTGSYSNLFTVIDRNSKVSSTLEATHNPTYRTVPVGSSADFVAEDYAKKVLQVVYHPWRNLICTASAKNIYLHAQTNAM